jgi:hypothetical protein
VSWLRANTLHNMNVTFENTQRQIRVHMGLWAFRDAETIAVIAECTSFIHMPRYIHSHSADDGFDLVFWAYGIWQDHGKNRREMNRKVASGR